MRRETALALSIVGVSLAMLGVALLAPGAIAQHEAQAEPSYLTTHDVLIAPEEVGGETARLAIELELQHDGPESEDVRVELRAIDRDTGLLEDTSELSIDRIEGDRHVSVSGTITVDREGDYDLQALVYVDDRQVNAGSARLSGLDGLEPEYANSPVTFHRFTGADLPAVAYSVDEAGARADLDVSAYVTNGGDDPSDRVEVELIARQTDSAIVADRERVGVDRIEPGQTATPSATLTVPDGYNYHLDAVIWRDGVIVDTVRTGATLNPNTTAPDPDDGADSEGAIDIGDFEDEDDDVYDTVEDDSLDEDDDAPGFGFAVAVVALVLGLLAAARLRSTDSDTNSLLPDR